jgi:AcrR family transcriptional regulator
MARPRTDIEPRILHAAREHFLQHGVDGASLRTIARAAHTNVGMIYYYFKTKDDLFLAVVEEVYVKLLAELEEVLGQPAPLRVKLEKLYVRIGAASPEEVDVVRLVIREALTSTQRFERVFTRFQQGHVAMLFRAFGEAAAAGEIDASVPVPMLVIPALAIGGIPQLLKHAAGDKPPFSMLPDSKALAALSVDVLFRGVAPKGAG